MSTLSAFFKGSDTTLGIFYPNHYIVSAFHDLGTAERAATAMRRAGFPDEDVIAVPGNDVIELAREEHAHHPVLTAFIGELSRVLGTEAAYTDRDLELAKRGAGYLAVYCPNEALKKKAWELLHPRQPLLARYYSFSGIEHLTGEV